MDALPRELWDFILSFLHQPNEVVRAALVCRELYAIVLANPHTHALVGLPRFNKKESSRVELQHHGRRASSRSKLRRGPFYPAPDLDTAYVHAIYTDLVGPGPDTAAKLLHFLIDCDPSDYMSVSVVSARGTDPGSGESKVKTIATSFFSDGDMHTYGMPVLLDGKARKAAQFKRGDIVSVQLGTRSNTNSSQSGPGWSRAIEAVDRWQPGAVASGQPGVHPYAVFFKNGRMVHHPVVFPSLQAAQGSVRVGVFFAKAGERVRLVAPPAAMVRQLREARKQLRGPACADNDTKHERTWH